jgi:hypothetical protein
VWKQIILLKIELKASIEVSIRLKYTTIIIYFLCAKMKWTGLWFSLFTFVQSWIVTQSNFKVQESLEIDILLG